MREMRRSGHVGVGVVEVGDLAPADDLHPVRVDVVEVADQVGGRARVAHRGLVEVALRVRVAGDPLPVQRVAVLLEQRLGADDGRLHARCAVAPPRRRALGGGARLHASRDRLQRLPGGDQPVHLGRRRARS